MRAEALLCEGLQDDRVALDRAIDAFEEALAQEPQNFFARLYLAEALRRRFPLSEDAIQAFSTAQRVLDRADVGAARTDLGAYLIQMIGELRQQRQGFSPAIRDAEATVDAGAASGHQMGQSLTLVADTGPLGLTRAAAALDAYLGAHHDDVVDTFYRAEILSGRLGRPALRALYQAAESHLCSDDKGDVASTQACGLTRRRLKQFSEGGARIDSSVEP